MKAGRACSDRPAGAREYRLVAVAVRGTVDPFDVRRERHVPDRVDSGVDLRPILRPEPYRPPAEELTRHNFAMQPDAALEHEPCSWFQFLARVHERIPFPNILPRRRAIGISKPDEEALDRTAARHAMADQSRGEHARVVDNQEIARNEQLWQLTDVRVSDGAG